MTGLDPGRHVIVEIATLITNDDLELIAEGPDLVVHASDSRIVSWVALLSQRQRCIINLHCIRTHRHFFEQVHAAGVSCVGCNHISICIQQINKSAGYIA